MSERNFFEALRALREAGVDFLVVGGLAEALNGSPVSLLGLDVVHSREPREYRATLVGT